MNLFHLQNTEFQRRHNGPNAADTKTMLQAIGVNSLDDLGISLDIITIRKNIIRSRIIRTKSQCK